ncbi:parkin coregulated gene protein isoform X2 [Uranotaenia lowii]|uniref:parkin coregulated gene protein isoform X2 n=1 Tax=Uranotaenia lowii TaxID=190385 RepID=UPI00247AE3CC|nr:parkin coregulated gene protein isoform X2 [Uranotaenia lowii]
MATKSSSGNFGLHVRPLSGCNHHGKISNGSTTHTGTGRSIKSASALRPVPAFSIESLQKGTFVLGPPKAQKSKYMLQPKATSFRMYYDRGDLPIKMEYLTGGDKIAWTVDIDKLDYGLYLPLFFDGLSEIRHPYKTYARQGVQDLLSHGGDKIYPVIPQLIIPIKNALNTRNVEVMCVTLRIIQQLVMASDLIGPALVPFYRQLLPMFNAYKVKNKLLFLQVKASFIAL